MRNVGMKTGWIVGLGLCLLGACAEPDGAPEIESIAGASPKLAGGGTPGDGVADVDAVGQLLPGPCTATLIGSRVVLTAAHCLGFDDTKALLNDKGGTSTGVFFKLAGPGQNVTEELRRWWVMGYYFGMYDVAVAELENDIPASTATPLEVALDWPEDGEPVTVWGTGATRGTVRCTDAGCGWNKDVVFPPGFVRQHASDTWAGRTTAHGWQCPGDSGGPTLNAAGEIIAVASSGSCGAAPDGKGDAVSFGLDISRLSAIYGRAQLCKRCPKYAFRTDTGHYLQAVDEGGGALTTDPTWVGVWETFRVIGVGNYVALQTANGHFVSAYQGGGGIVTADQDRIGASESFSSDYAYTYFRTKLTSQYVCAENGGEPGGEVTANRWEKWEWETFQPELQ